LAMIVFRSIVSCGGCSLRRSWRGFILPIRVGDVRQHQRRINPHSCAHARDRE
jgi:hypothetical protein